MGQMVFPSVSNEIFRIEPLPYLICIPKKKCDMGQERKANDLC